MIDVWVFCLFQRLHIKKRSQYKMEDFKSISQLNYLLELEQAFFNKVNL